ncbi:Peptide deformylase 1A chloroplastic [Bienertia sinuspersici]
MEVLPRFSNRIFSLSSNHPTSKITPFLHLQHSLIPPTCPNPYKTTRFLLTSKPLNSSSSSSSTLTTRAGWLLGLGKDKQQKLPDIVKAGDPVLHEAARVLDPKEIGSEKIQTIIDDMIKVMRMAPGVGLAAPQIGLPLKIIVLEDTKEYISYQPKAETKAQDRHPFDLLWLHFWFLFPLNSPPNANVDGYRAVVERHLDVEVRGLDRDGKPVKVDASGWQARILQHECDHLEGILYVDRMQPRTFRTVDNLDLP